MKKLMALIMIVSLSLGMFTPAKARAESVQGEKESLKITLNKLTFNQKDTLNFKVVFKVDEKRLKDQRLMIQILDTKQNGIQVFEELTDGNGEVRGSVKLSKKQPNGSYYLVVTTKYRGVVFEQKAGFTIGVSTQGEYLKTDKLVYKKGEIVNIQGIAKLNDSFLKGVVIPVKIVFNERVVFVGEAVTDENGAFKICYDLQGSAYGTYMVYASVPGSLEDELNANFKCSK